MRIRPHFDALYIRNTFRDKADAIARIQDALSATANRQAGTIRAANSPWLQMQFERDAHGGEKLASQLSKTLGTDVLYLFYASVSDTFGYWHFENGEERRAIGNGFEEQYNWDFVRGEPEPWETAVLWESRTAKRVLGDHKHSGRSIYEQRIFAAGSGYPTLNPDDLGRELQLPGFVNREWEWEHAINPTK